MRQFKYILWVIPSLMLLMASCGKDKEILPQEMWQEKPLPEEDFAGEGKMQGVLFGAALIELRDSVFMANFRNENDVHFCAMLTTPLSKAERPFVRAQERNTGAEGGDAMWFAGFIQGVAEMTKSNDNVAVELYTLYSGINLQDIDNLSNKPVAAAIATRINSLGI